MFQPIYVVAQTLPAAWEQAVDRCWKEGASFETHYDRPGDPPSRDVFATIHVTEPFLEPRIHRSFPDGLNGLEKYRNEVVLGVHDYWIAKGESYTYHDRIKDQIAEVVAMLRKDKFTRRAKLEVWRPSDLSLQHAPCCQYFWFRGDANFLHMTMHIRSNDAFRAAFMNMYAFTELQAYIADQVGLLPGTYTHVADSFHIYGANFEQFAGLQKLQSRPFEDRTYRSDSDLVRECFREGCDELLAETEMPEAMKQLVLARKEVLRARCETCGKDPSDCNCTESVAT